MADVLTSLKYLHIFYLVEAYMIVATFSDSQEYYSCKTIQFF